MAQRPPKKEFVVWSATPKIGLSELHHDVRIIIFQEMFHAVCLNHSRCSHPEARWDKNSHCEGELHNTSSPESNEMPVVSRSVLGQDCQTASAESCSTEEKEDVNNFEGSERFSADVSMKDPRKRGFTCCQRQTRNRDGVVKKRQWVRKPKEKRKPCVVHPRTRHRPVLRVQVRRRTARRRRMVDLRTADEERGDKVPSFLCASGT